jgi:hypothetical protein
VLFLHVIIFCVVAGGHARASCRTAWFTSWSTEDHGKRYSAHSRSAVMPHAPKIICGFLSCCPNAEHA